MPAAKPRPPVVVPSEAEVHRAIERILVDRDAAPLRWAVNYCLASRDMSGEALRTQCLYILNNITKWRNSAAADVRSALKRFAGVKEK